MFVLFFAIFIFLFTVFENIFIVSAWFVIGVLALFIMRKIKLIGLCMLAFFLAISSTWLFNFRHNQGLYGLLTGGPSTVFIGTGQVLTRQGQGKYLVTDGTFDYLLVSKNDYQTADKIRLAGNMKLTKDTRNSGFLFSHSFAESLSGLFHYEFNYDKRLKMKGIHGTIFEQNSIIIVPPEKEGAQRAGGLGFIPSLRNGLQNLVANSYGNNKTAGLVLGMLIGDKSQIPASDYQSFIDSGLVHLIAVSGGNIIMIVVFLGFILLRLPFYLRNFIILLCIITYGFLCGMDSSVLRAVIMGGLGMIALFRGRQIDIWRALSIAFLGILLYNPYYLVYDVGFLFSFSAIIGLVYFGKIGQNSDEKNSIQPKNKNHRLIKKIQFGLNYVRKDYLSPSIGATLGILPTMIFFMGKINFLGILGNLLVLPIIPFIMIYGFISTVLYQIFPRHGLLQIEERLINYVYRVSEKTGMFGLYMNVEGDRIKYLLLGAAIIWFMFKRLKSQKNSQNTSTQEIEKSGTKTDKFIDS